jgi:hypothetical protein
MKTKIKLLFTGLITALGVSSMTAQSTSQNFKVLGNCGMCEKTIEKAALKNGAKTASWDEETKVLAVNFDAKKTSADKILKGVAYAGYDNEKYLAPEDAYNNLHSCCKYERAKPKQSATAAQTQTKSASETKTQEVQTKNELEQSYSKYFELKDALVNSDNKASVEKAKELVSDLEAVNMGAMGEKEHNAFVKYLSGLKSDANNIAGTKDLGKQRNHFSSLSDKTFELMKVAKPSYTVYLENCPMFNDGKGANWISKESAIKNPYYGSQMLTCGKVKNTLK